TSRFSLDELMEELKSQLQAVFTFLKVLQLKRRANTPPSAEKIYHGSSEDCSLYVKRRRTLWIGVCRRRVIIRLIRSMIAGFIDGRFLLVRRRSARSIHGFRRGRLRLLTTADSKGAT